MGGARKRAGTAILRGLSSSVKVCMKTGRLQHRPPPLVFETTTRPPPPTSFSLTDSIMRVEAGLIAGELRATAAIGRGLRLLNEELARQEEALLLDEMDALRLT